MDKFYLNIDANTMTVRSKTNSLTNPFYDLSVSVSVDADLFDDHIVGELVHDLDDKSMARLRKFKRMVQSPPDSRSGRNDASVKVCMVS